MILVTGAAGFIGSHLCQRILSMGIKCVGIDNFDSFYSRDIKTKNIASCIDNPQFDLFEVDICNKEILEDIFSSNKVSMVIHLAALAGVRPSLKDSKRYFDVNVGGTINLLESARKYGVRKFILASSSSVYGNNTKVPFSEDDFVDNPISPYAASKKAMELFAHTFYSLYDLQIACLRFFTVYGPRQRPDLAIAKFCKKISNNESIQQYGDGSTYRDYTFIDDIISGIENTISWVNNDEKAKFEVFNLGENTTVKLSYLLELIQKTLNKKAKIDIQPEQDGDVKRTYADISKAQQFLGYQPTTKIEKGLQLYVEWLKSDGD